jgi:hypothetical protein
MVEIPPPQRALETSRNDRPRRLGLILVGLLAMLVVGLAWLVGYAASRVFSNDAPERPAAREATSNSDAEKEPDARDRKPHRHDQPKGDKDRHRRRSSGTNDSVTSAGGGAPVSGPAVGGAAPNDTADPGQQDSSKKPKEDSAPTFPPAPTNYLYLLYNEKTGDHLVTTDGGVASEYEGKGYHGGAIARVYTYAEKDTKAITTNGGTAYVFASASPKTEPESRTLSLYYSSDGEGDFFYTTSQSEASQEGWQSSLVGYVRTLS